MVGFFESNLWAFFAVVIVTCEAWGLAKKLVAASLPLLARKYAGAE